MAHEVQLLIRPKIHICKHPEGGWDCGVAHSSVDDLERDMEWTPSFPLVKKRFNSQQQQWMMILNMESDICGRCDNKVVMAGVAAWNRPL